MEIRTPCCAHFRQHEIVEYLTYLRGLLCPSIAQCTWQARQTLDGSSRVIDRGSCHRCIHCILRRAMSFRSSIFWTTGVPSKVCKALLMCLGVLLIQINRFNQGSLRVDKSNIPVKVDPHIMVPGFAADLTPPHAMEARYARYRCTAASLHEGQTPESGHYRTVLHRGQQLLLTNDKVPASRLATNPANLQYVYTSVYAAIYVHCPEGRSAVACLRH